MESLYRRFGERTQRYLRGLLGDEADDVQQEVWTVVLRELARVADVGAFRTRLFRVTRTTALDFLRRRNRLSSVFVTDDEAPATSAPSIASCGSSADSAGARPSPRCCSSPATGRS